MVETVQRAGICVEVIAPAPGLSDERALAAQQLAIDLATSLGVVGLLAVELFETADGIVVNELAIAPAQLRSLGPSRAPARRSSSSICAPSSTTRWVPPS